MLLLITITISLSTYKVSDLLFCWKVEDDAINEEADPTSGLVAAMPNDFLVFINFVEFTRCFILIFLTISYSTKLKCI